MAQLDSSTIYGNLSVTGDASLSGNLSVTGTTSLTGKLSLASLQVGTSTTAGYVLTADASGNATWQANTEKYLSGVSGTCGGTITFTIASGTNVTWNSSHTHSYLPLGGGTLTGGIILPSNQYWLGGAGTSVINLQNSDIIGANSIVFGDEADSAGEGLAFPKTGKSGSTATADYDTVRALDGTFYFNSNAVWHAGNLAFGTGSANMATGDHLHDGRYYTETETATQYECIKAGFNVSGGGTITYDASSNLKWGTRFIVICNGFGSDFSTNGYFDITCPSSGTITGVGGAANATVTAAGIPLGSWQALYYILPLGLSNANIAANFRIATFTSALNVPHDWLLVAVRNGEDAAVKLCNGVILKPGQTWTGGDGIVGTSHTHANLVAGNGITGTTYTGGTAYTWSIASHAGTAGSIGTINIGADTVGVNLGTTGTTACAGNDARLSDARTPVAHGDSLHNCYVYARISFAVGQSQAVWTHNKNWANYIIQITPNSPETHFYYTNRTVNAITICLDDPAYEALDVDVVLINANTITTTGFTMS